MANAFLKALSEDRPNSAPIDTYLSLGTAKFSSIEVTSTNFVALMNLAKSDFEKMGNTEQLSEYLSEEMTIDHWEILGILSISTDEKSAPGIVREFLWHFIHSIKPGQSSKLNDSDYAGYLAHAMQHPAAGIRNVVDEVFERSRLGEVAIVRIIDNLYAYDRALETGDFSKELYEEIYPQKKRLHRTKLLKIICTRHLDKPEALATAMTRVANKQDRQMATQLIRSELEKQVERFEKALE